MKVSAKPTILALLVLGGCSANLRPPDFSPIEYLILKSPASDKVPEATLRAAAIRQATAGCRQSHQAFKLVDGNASGPANPAPTDQNISVQQLKDLDARGYSSVSIAFRCVSGAAAT